MKQLAHPWPANISIDTESFSNFLWQITHGCLFPYRETLSSLRTAGYSYNKLFLFWTIIKYNHVREEHLLDFSGRMNLCESINNADITLSVWVFTVNHLLRWMRSDSHLPKLFSQQPLQIQARTRSWNAVYELSIGSAGFLDYYFLVAIFASCHFLFHPQFTSILWNFGAVRNECMHFVVTWLRWKNGLLRAWIANKKDFSAESFELQSSVSHRKAEN